MVVLLVTDSPDSIPGLPSSGIMGCRVRPFLKTFLETVGVLRGRVCMRHRGKCGFQCVLTLRHKGPDLTQQPWDESPCVPAPSPVLPPQLPKTILVSNSQYVRAGLGTVHKVGTALPEEYSPINESWKVFPTRNLCFTKLAIFNW